MKTTNWDAVAASAPQDRQASVIRDGSGDLWAPKVSETSHHWDAPPPPLAERPEWVVDRTGEVIDRLKVVRYHGKRKSGGHWFLVRCTCGAYELRRDKFFATRPQRTEGQEHACEACDYLHTIKFHASNRNTGASRKAEESRLDELAAKYRKSA